MNNQKKRKLYLYGCIASLIIAIISFLVFSRPIFTKNFNLLNHTIETFVSLLGFGIFGNLSRWLYSQYKRLNVGLKGERKTQKTLQGLPKDYVVIPNVSIENDDKVSEIDNLVLSPRGLVIVETKSYNGVLEGKEDDAEWKYTKTSAKGNEYSKNIRNPLKQAKRQTFILSNILKENGIHCWIDSYVYILEAKCYVSSDKIFLDERSLIHKIVSSGKDNALSQEEIEKIKEILGK